MATETETVTAAPGARASQVRVQLKSRSSDIQLPQETGPILVSTGMIELFRRIRQLILAIWHEYLLTSP
jgi:hypothetical protein